MIQKEIILKNGLTVRIRVEDVFSPKNRSFSEKSGNNSAFSVYIYWQK